MSGCAERRRCRQHLNYKLDCADFADLLARAEGRCEICRIAPEDSKHGMLHIDHDETVGQWAARGLLCSRCNSHLFTPSVVAPTARATYISKAWFLGIYMERPAEPGLGTSITVSRHRTYERWPEGWCIVKGNGLPLNPYRRSWEEIWWLEGPRLVARRPIAKHASARIGP